MLVSSNVFENIVGQQGLEIHEIFSKKLYDGFENLKESKAVIFNKQLIIMVKYSLSS